MMTHQAYKKIKDFRKTLYKKPALQSGFTLVELLVSLTLFTVVVLAMVTTLYTVNAAWKRAEGMHNVMDNLNFALESISRTIRTSDTIACGTSNDTPADCTFANGGVHNVITMDSTLGTLEKVRYARSYDPGTGVYSITKSVNSDDTGNTWTAPVNLTSANINIEELNFFVAGSSTLDTIRPNVIMMVKGTATAADQTIPFAIQTYVSQRNPD